MKRASLPAKKTVKSGETSREKLIQGALELFAERGLDGASVRDIAKKSGQNLGAITYYFGDKNGLYTAVAEHIVEIFKSRIGPERDHIQAKLEAGTLTPEEHLLCLKKLLASIVMALVRKDKLTHSISQLFNREQVVPTHAFPIFYENLHYPVHRLMCLLAGGYLGKDPDSQEIILRVYALFGSAMVFRMAHALVLKRTGWKKMADQEVAEIAHIVSEHVELVMRGLT